MQPRSRGRVSVVSDDPEVPPIIEHRYDSDPHDVAMLSAGAELARELASSSTKVGHATWSTSQHLCATAPMGTEGDAAAVVDAAVQGARRRRTMGGRRLGPADHHRPRSARHDRDARPPRRRVRRRMTHAPSVADDGELSAVAPRGPDRDESGRDGEERSRRPRATGPSRRETPISASFVERGPLRAQAAWRRPARWRGIRSRRREPGRETAARPGASALVYCAASTDPATAMPTAAPTSRVASLTADATPCFSVGNGVHDRRCRRRNTQADTGAGDQERPDELDIGRVGLRVPHAEQSSGDQEQAERRPPAEGRPRERIRCIVAPRAMIGTATGPSAQAVWSAL